MRKILIIFIGILIAGNSIAGGLVTNHNQSAMFTRMQNRSASTGIDAVYYNPAGLTRLGEGFYASLNNQFVHQTRTVGSNYPFLSGTGSGSSYKEYVGKIYAPVFPGVYVAYNTGNLSFSAGFNPVGGGGGAKYNKGLPSFEMGISDLVPLLSNQKIPTTDYSADIFFEGSSIYFGYQANAGYKISDMFSVAAGVRLVSAKNTYSGYLRDISINPDYAAFGSSYTGTMNSASQFFADGSTFLTGLATSSTSAATGLSNAMTGGVSPDTPLSAMPASTVAGVTQLLGAAGIDATGMNIGTAAATLNAIAPVFTSKATAMAGYSAQTQDIEVDVEETGVGYTPILSVNFSPSDKMDISVKYEFKTKLELTTKVKDNKSGGLFTEGEKIVADIPAILTIGAEVKPMDKLIVAATMNIYFDKNLDYDGSKSIDIDMTDRNFLEYGMGLEYALSSKLRASAGWLATRTSANSNYLNDQRYSTNTNTFGAGFGYHITPMIDLNMGGSYSFYDEGSKSYSKTLMELPVSWNETYNKKTWIVSIGLDFSFGKAK
ncbi:MAG TPA: outer membrane protein transport protein [Bacteroidales bacterium]|nr:outer membrane protein transport protein [Bacteroidales bacterium]